MADSRQVCVSKHCPTLEWEIDGVVFSGDFLVMKIGGYDAILGVQWLRTLGKFSMELDRKLLEFHKKGKLLQFYGVGAFGGIPAKEVLSIRDCVVAAQLYLVQAADNIQLALSSSSLGPEQCSELHELLRRFDDVFAEPKGLPPCRSFAATQIDYLGHLILVTGVQADPRRIEAIARWPIPTNIKELRGFLELTGYYRRFVRQYGGLAKPLTELLRKDVPFIWSDVASTAFLAFKEAMMSPPVLVLPDFNETFVVETDASGQGLEAVLSQKGHPIAYASKALPTKKKSLSAYEREMLAVIFQPFSSSFRILTLQLFLLLQSLWTRILFKGGSIDIW